MRNAHPDCNVDVALRECILIFKLSMVKLIMHISYFH